MALVVLDDELFRSPIRLMQLPNHADAISLESLRRGDRIVGFQVEMEVSAQFDRGDGWVRLVDAFQVEELIARGELSEAERERVEFQRKMTKYVGAPLLGAFSCAAGAVMFAQIANPVGITGAPISWLLGGNPFLDGVWLFARYLSAPRDPALIGQEEMVFAADVVEVRPAG